MTGGPLIIFMTQDGPSRAQLVISHFCVRFLLNSRYVNLFCGVIDRKTQGAEYRGFTADHAVVGHFQLKHAVLVKSSSKFNRLIW